MNRAISQCNYPGGEMSFAHRGAVNADRAMLPSIVVIVAVVVVAKEVGR